MFRTYALRIITTATTAAPRPPPPTPRVPCRRRRERGGPASLLAKTSRVAPSGYPRRRAGGAGFALDWDTTTLNSDTSWRTRRRPADAVLSGHSELPELPELPGEQERRDLRLRSRGTRARGAGDAAAADQGVRSRSAGFGMRGSDRCPHREQEPARSLARTYCAHGSEASWITRKRVLLHLKTTGPPLLSSRTRPSSQFGSITMVRGSLVVVGETRVLAQEYE
jgi:hypothetical protein